MKCKYVLFLFVTFINILLFKNGTVKAIVGGMDAAIEQFKYHVSLLINDQYACGGSIINNEYILTAAQCIIDKSGKFLNVKLKIIAGVSNLDSTTANMFIRDVIRAYVPYEFRNSKNKSNVKDRHYLETGDIALLQLSTILPLGTNPVLDNLIVPFKKHYKYEKYMYRKANITGFGLNTPIQYKSASNLSNLKTRLNSHKKLIYAEATVQRKTSCDAVYHQYQDSHLCASIDEPYNADSAGTCHGDIGGPLVVDEVTIIGVLVKYRNNCQEINAALYTRVTHYISFLNDVREVDTPPDIRVANYEGAEVMEIIPPERMSDLVSST